MTVEVGVAPERSYEQRMAALERANNIRSHRADLKRQMKARRVTAWDVLTCEDELVATMKVWDLLLAVPKVGRVKVNKTLAQARISPSKTIGGLTERQRRELAAVLPQVAVAC